MERVVPTLNVWPLYLPIQGGLRTLGGQARRGGQCGDSLLCVLFEVVLPWPPAGSKKNAFVARSKDAVRFWRKVTGGDLPD